LKILVIEDSQDDAEFNIRALQRAGYDVEFTRVENAFEMEKAYLSDSWDIILSDYMMPEFSVQEALEIYNQHGADIPFIVISGAIGEEKAVQLIKAGVHDYLLKSNMTRFVSVVERELRDAGTKREYTRMRLALSASEEKYRNYVENAPDIVFVADRTGKYIEVNNAACRITGYSRDELLNMSVLDIIAPESKEHGEAMIREIQVNGVMQADLCVYHKDGSMHWFAVDAVRLSDYSFLGFTKDITERKNANLEVIQAREDLQKFNQHLMDVREDERATIAREIHDELGQALTAMKIDLNWVVKNFDNWEKAQQKLARIIEMTNDTIRNVQRISSELRPGLLDDLGLATAIEWYCNEFEQRSGVKCQLCLEDITFTDQRINLTLFRIMQEALTNVIRHARASTVVVTLVSKPDGITLLIDDNGVGISPKKIGSRNSLGLIGIRERVRQFDGSVEFTVNPVSGTRIIVNIPVLKSEPVLL